MKLCQTNDTLRDVLLFLLNQIHFLTLSLKIALKNTSYVLNKQALGLIIRIAYELKSKTL